jgi:hypothetical protein
MFFTCITANTLLKPNCINCKWFIPNQNGVPDYGSCKMTQKTLQYKGKEIVVNDFAKHCRENENLCGENGYLYELKDYSNTNKYLFTQATEDKFKQAPEYEIKKIFARMKKYNTPRYYK